MMQIRIMLIYLVCLYSTFPPKTLQKPGELIAHPLKKFSIIFFLGFFYPPRFYLRLTGWWRSRPKPFISFENPDDATYARCSPSDSIKQQVFQQARFHRSSLFENFHDVVNHRLLHHQSPTNLPVFGLPLCFVLPAFDQPEPSALPTATGAAPPSLCEKQSTACANAIVVSLCFPKSTMSPPFQTWHSSSSRTTSISRLVSWF